MVNWTFAQTNNQTVFSSAREGVPEILCKEDPDFNPDPVIKNELIILRDNTGAVLGRLRLETTEEWKLIKTVLSECDQALDNYFLFDTKFGSENPAYFVENFGPLIGIEISDEDLQGIRLERRFEQIVYDFYKKYKNSFQQVKRFDPSKPATENRQLRIPNLAGEKCKKRELKIYQRITKYFIHFEHPHKKEWKATLINHDDVFHVENKVVEVPSCCPKPIPHEIPTEIEELRLTPDGLPVPIPQESGDELKSFEKESDLMPGAVPKEPKKTDPDNKGEDSNYFYPNGFSNELNYIVTGLDQTTGHVLDMKIHNPTEKTISYPGSKVLVTSVDSTQFYIATVPPFEAGPHQTITLPIDGDCGTIYKPPLGPGQESAPVSTWYTPASAGPPPNPGEELADSFTPIEISQGDIVATYPGTEIPLGASANLEDNPSLLFELDDIIDSTFQELWENDQINVPIPKDRAYREVRQQAKWYIYSIYEGNPYTVEDLMQRLGAQIKEQTGMEVEDLPPEVQDQLTTGGTNIFETLTFIGKEAKLVTESTEDIPLSGEGTENIPIKHESGCKEDLMRTCNPISCFDFEMTIDNDFKDAAERAKIVKRVRKNISQQADITQEQVWKEYDLNDNPTSASAFWKPGNVGGFASAYAKTLFKTNTGWSYTGTTEKLSAKAEGTSNLTLTYTPGPDCKAFVVGVSKASILASSTAFDAMLGNTFGEDDKDQLEVLKFIKGAGKLAVKYLIDRKTGETKDDFGKYAKDAITDQFKDKLKEQTIGKLQEYLEDKLENLLDNLGFGGGLTEYLTKGIPDLGELMKEHLGFNPFKLADELGDKIEEGLEAAFNLAFVSDTYATANGFLVITVGTKTGTAKAQTRITYARQGTESTSQAMNGTGPKCDELFLSDVQANSLTITTKGNAELTAQAFGNGKASSFLESQQLQVLLGICICGNNESGKPNYELMVNHQWFHEKPAPSTKDIGATIEKELIKQIDAKLKDGTFNNATSQEDWRKFLESEVKKISENQVSIKPACSKE